MWGVCANVGNLFDLNICQKKFFLDKFGQI